MLERVAAPQPDHKVQAAEPRKGHKRAQARRRVPPCRKKGLVVHTAFVETDGRGTNGSKCCG